MGVFFTITYCIKIYLLVHVYGTVGFFWGCVIEGFLITFIPTIIIGLTLIQLAPNFSSFEKMAIFFGFENDPSDEDDGLKTGAQTLEPSLGRTELNVRVVAKRLGLNFVGTGVRTQEPHTRAKPVQAGKGFANGFVKNVAFGVNVEAITP